MVTKTINALGDFTTSSYDGLQRFISAADYVSNSQTTPYYTTYMYDAVGRILKESIPFHQDGSMMEYSVKTYGYDANGNVTASKITTNKPGEAETESVTTYSYNNRDQMIRTQTGSDFTTYTYDAAGNPLTVTTANGEAVTGYAYDHLGNLTTMTDAMGQKETYTYDLNGNLLTTTDRNGNVTAFTYDDLGRQVNVQVKSAAGTLLSSKQTAYTLTGQTLSEQNDTATVTWKYDALGRMTQESETGGVVKNYTYNLADLRTGYQLLVGGAQKMNTTYTYDQMNRLSTVLENGAQAASYTYDKNGNRATMTNGNGTTVTYAYNAANLVTSLQNKKGLSTLSNYVYQYYLDGNQAQKNDHTGRSTSYAYDAQRRLTQEAESGAADAVTKAYRFDEAGNRLSMTVTGAESYTTNYTYDRNNRLLTETRTSGGTQQVTDYTYDANGNTQTKTTGASSEQYTYDGFNRLVKVVNAAGTTTYDYRPDGLRNSKTVAGVKTAHIWDGQNMSAELNASGAILRAHIRGVGLIAEDDAAGTRQYALYNAHGDVVQLNNTNGVVTREYQYDAFGNERNPDATDANPFRYCGEYFDAETGDIYLRARYYDPAIGRFTQMDTHWNPGNMIYGDNYKNIPELASILQSSNLYVYSTGNPIKYLDATGKISKEKADEIIINNTQNIKDAAAEFGVNPGILAATIYAEQRLNVNWKDHWIDPLAADVLDVSLGVSQIRISTAVKIENAGYIEKTVYYEWHTNSAVENQRAGVVYKLQNDETNIRYATAYLSYIQDIWKESYPEIDGRTAILATLYNISEYGSHGVNSNPSSNEFGSFAKENYYMRKLLGLD